MQITLVLCSTYEAPDSLDLLVPERKAKYRLVPQSCWEQSKISLVLDKEVQIQIFPDKMEALCFVYCMSLKEVIGP